MIRGGAESPIDDIAFLARSEHRVSALLALTDRRLSRSELCEVTEVSPSTMRRTLREFEARSWIRDDGHRYEATRSGEAIAVGMEELMGRVETERKLRDVQQWLPETVIELTFERRSRTTVSVAEQDAPYRPVNRFRSLLDGAEEFRFVGVDAGLYEPCLGEFRRRVLDGMQAEIIDQPNVAEHMISTYPERCAKLFESGNLTVLLHEDLPPYGVTLLDDRIAISGYDADRGGTKLLIDTALPEARTWAESVYETYRSEARPLAPERVGE